MTRRGAIPFAAAFLCVGLATGPVIAQEGAKPAPREIERTFPAGKLDSLRVKGAVGDIILTAGSGEKITLRLRIEAKQKSGGIFRRERWGDPALVELTEATSGSELRLDLREREPHGREGLKETWTIEAPARLRAKLSMTVGRIEAEGISGGCELKVNVGDIQARLAGGNIQAEANVGSVNVETSTPSYGDIDVEANVGDVRVDLGDHKVRTPKPPGAGNSFRMEGPGRDRIRLRANVGDARLTIRKTV